MARFIRKKESDISSLLQTHDLSLTEVRAEQTRLVQWMKNLKKTDLLSRDWALQVLGELALQCAGKCYVPTARGPEITYHPRTALKALELGAQISGALNTGNGNNPNFNFFTGGEDKRQTTAIPSGPDRAKEVFSILNDHGGFGSKSIEYVDAEVVCE